MRSVVHHPGTMDMCYVLRPPLAISEWSRPRNPCAVVRPCPFNVLALAQFRRCFNPEWATVGGAIPEWVAVG